MRLLETDEMGLTDNFFAVTDGKTAYIDSESHEQVAGMITTAGATDPKVVNAVVGSNIFFDNSHILKGGTYEADHITISAHSIVNIDDDTTFITETAAAPVANSTATNGAFVSNPFDVNLSEGIHNMMTNSGYLNVRAGKKATVTGNYEQAGGFFVTNVETSSITAGDQGNVFDDNKFGQLDVSGNADLSGGILVMMDDVGADGKAGTNLDETTQTAGAETRLVDVVKAATLSVGDANLTHDVHSGAADSTANDLLAGVKVQDNSRLYDFEVVDNIVPVTNSRYPPSHKGNVFINNRVFTEIYLPLYLPCSLPTNAYFLWSRYENESFIPKRRRPYNSTGNKEDCQ